MPGNSKNDHFLAEKNKTSLQILPYLNHEQNFVEKFIKLSKIDFSLEHFTVGFLQFYYIKIV